MSNRSEPAVEVDEVTMRYGDVIAVDHLSFTAPSGSVTALLGPNGAGKTSTIEALEGYRRPTAGRLRVLDRDPHRDHRHLRNRMGVMLQRGGVYPSMRTGEVARLFASYYAESEDPASLLERVGLADRAGSSWRQLSGGEQQRLSLALALIGRPEVVFLDEPTAGVDVQGRQLIRAVVAEAAAGGACVLLASHELDEVERMADHIVIVDRGRLVASGATSEILAGGEAPCVRFRAPAGIDVAALAAAISAPVTEVAPGDYEVAREGTPAIVAAITAWMADRDLQLGDLRARRQRLEDVFARLTAADRESRR